jgi:hypothetical protein
MIGSVVVDQINAVTAPVKGRQQDRLKKIDISFGVEVLALMPVGESPLIQGDGAQDLLGVALAEGRDLRL